MENLNACKIVADSLSPFGTRLVSSELQFPRMVLAEFNTHKMIVKNSASSRAIPFKRMLSKVQENTFIPFAYQKDHSGMQGTEYHEDEQYIRAGNKAWQRALREAIVEAKYLNHNLGITKQLANRLLEPFAYHTCLASATEWENFFALRASEHAEIHIADLAYKMLDAFNDSKPKKLEYGEWHLPYGDNLDEDDLLEAMALEGKHGNAYDWEGIMLKISTARCARLSYKTLGDSPKIDYMADLKLTNETVIKNGHWSPAEHPARCMDPLEWDSSILIKPIPKLNFDIYQANNPQYVGGYIHWDVELKDKDWVYIKEYGWCGNFRGFIPYRKFFANENRTDSRLLKHQY